MIKKRNLDNSLIQWIMSQTNLGPLVGDIQYIAPARAATSQFRAAWVDSGVDESDISTTLAAAYAKTVTRRNDVILAAPGLYNESASLTWGKDNVHLMGIGTGNPHSDQYLTAGHPLFYVTGTSIVQAINITGERNAFYNTIFQNSGNNAACKQAVLLDGYGNSFYRCGIQGNMAANQRSNATCCSLNIADGGFYPYFEDCLIGSAEWGERSAANSGQIYFSGNTSSSMPSHGKFKNCVIRSASSTATCAAVKMYDGTYFANFYWIWEDCLFYNLDTNWVAKCNQVFYFPVNVPTQHHVLKGSTMAVGYDEWQDRDTGECVVSALPATDDGGGLAVLPNDDAATI